VVGGPFTKELRRVTCGSTQSCQQKPGIETCGALLSPTSETPTRFLRHCHPGLKGTEKGQKEVRTALRAEMAQAQRVGLPPPEGAPPPPVGPEDRGFFSGLES